VAGDAKRKYCEEIKRQPTMMQREATASSVHEIVLHDTSCGPVMLQADAKQVVGHALVHTCDNSLVLVDQVPQLLISLHVKGALVIPDPLHPWEPETVTRRKVLADDCAHICLHLHMWSILIGAT